MKHRLLAAAAAVALILPAAAQEAPPPSPGEIVAAAPASDWVGIAPEDLLVMDLAPDAAGKARRVVIQLMPAPFSQGWIGNIRKLAAAHWWDGTSVNRVQDNYVVQWGDATEQKVLPEGLATVPESEYTVTGEAISDANATHIDYGDGSAASIIAAVEDSFAASEARARYAEMSIISTRRPHAQDGWHERDSYAPWVEIYGGWPLAAEEEPDGGYRFWPAHCYAMVGVGRNLSPDTGSGAELYTVIGHAPRHLDRNIALVGRVISGIEHLSSLPRGTAALGFYETAAERTAIVSVRLGSDLPADARPRFEYLSKGSESFGRYVDARANRRDPFFNIPAGGADICNVPVPVRAVAQ
ncbi:MAG TPA: peptidylprolyl isomerase [Sphingopyxis sp.]|nr:peptidylprolyl isomerase [Sphingopyxis sp.]